MKRAFRPLAFVFVLVLTAGLVHASTPPIYGHVSGVELCPQSICKAAIFSGFFQGQIGLNPFAIGSVTVGIIHDDLPDPGKDSDITGGQWELKTLLRRYGGYVYKGNLHNNGDLTFDVDAVLVLTSGGFGPVKFHGTLHHDVFPPTVNGVFFQ